MQSFYLFFFSPRAAGHQEKSPPPAPSSLCRMAALHRLHVPPLLLLSFPIENECFIYYKYCITGFSLCSIRVCNDIRTYENSKGMLSLLSQSPQTGWCVSSLAPPFIPTDCAVITEYRSCKPFHSVHLIKRA